MRLHDCWQPQVPTVLLGAPNMLYSLFRPRILHRYKRKRLFLWRKWRKTAYEIKKEDQGKYGSIFVAILMNKRISTDRRRHWGKLMRILGFLGRKMLKSRKKYKASINKEMLILKWRKGEIIGVWGEIFRLVFEAQFALFRTKIGLSWWLRSRMSNF